MPLNTVRAVALWPLLFACSSRPVQFVPDGGALELEEEDAQDSGLSADGSVEFPEDDIGAFCNDRKCNGLEDCASCPEDCGSCTACGDGMCGDGEACETCAPDCGLCPACPDGTCAPYEDCESCSVDCGLCSLCGDGYCEGAEDCVSCTPDCGACAGCGDFRCDFAVENCTLCPDDCGTCATCGTGGCAPPENCFSCDLDCGVCSVCGNGSCEADEFETCINCSEDCGPCPVYDCPQMVDCAIECFAVAFPPELTCVTNCVSQGCADAQSAAQNFIDCAILAAFSGCGEDFMCILDACDAEYTACLAGYC